MKIKYAVYKGSVGLYAKEYFDKIDPELFTDRGGLAKNKGGGSPYSG